MMNLNRVWLCFCFFLIFQIAPVQGLVLGGTNVPKEKIVVYLLIGHSNMAGADYARSDAVPHARAWTYPIATKQWIQAKEPVSQKYAGLSGNGSGGPGMPFLKQMVAAYPDYYFGVITNASNSATCRGENTGSNGSNLDPSNNRYYDSTYLYHQIITAAKAVQNDVTFGGVMCMLGAVEATRTNDVVCKAFSDDIANLAKFIRRDLGLPNLPFIMGDYEAGATGEFSPSLPLPAIISAQTKLIPSKLAHSVVIDSKGIEMMDNHHYTAIKGQGEWARRAIVAIQANQYFPPNSAGVISAPRLRTVGYNGPWLNAKPGTMLLRADDGAYLIDGRSASEAVSGMTAPEAATVKPERSPTAGAR
jgi:hypothetical protein